MSRSRAFTLVELLTSTAVLAVLVMLMARVMGDTAGALTRTTAKIDQFREARAAFDAITTRLGQATLNTYWDYQYDNPTAANRIPLKYTRRSELRFISGPSASVLTSSRRLLQTHCVFFQAPLGETQALARDGSVEYEGFENLLCAWGYFVEFSSDAASRPPFLSEEIFPARHRYRLMEMRQPAEGNRIYNFTSGLDPKRQTYAGRDWFATGVTQDANVRVAAENVIALIVTPRLAQSDEAALKGGRNADHSPLAPNYLYDSSPSATAQADPRLNPVHQLPPLLQVTLVAIDESSAQRLEFSAATKDPFKLAKNKRFTKTADFSKDLLQSGDKESLENQLIRRRANYRIFNTHVIIRGAKWSRATTN